MPTPAFWRKWHRWIGAPATIFLMFVSVTGILLAFTEFLGEEEAAREANRAVVSAVRTDSPATAWSGPLAAAMTAAAAKAPGAPIDRITMDLKRDAATISIYTGKPAGGEDQRLIFDTKTGAFLRAEAYVDKPFLVRLHSGEAFGDGGLVAAMFWGLALLALTISGCLLYWRLMKVDRPDRTGFKKFFF
jgi:uncharacterized iron-regulated membrane protein